MGIIVDGSEIKSSKPELGKDEQDILDALHGRGALGEKLKKDLEKNWERAKYKIELQFMKARSAQRHESNLFSVQAWVSGKRFTGGGDTKMAFCGYWEGQGFQGKDVCRKPFEDTHFGINHAVCPHCKRENFLDEVTKNQHIEYAKKEGEDVKGLLKIPVVNPMLLGKLPPKKLAVFLTKIFRDLDSNADIYVKFHPTDIRCRDVPEIKKPDLYEKARADRVERKENRGLVIYPLANIIRDTVAGASLESRILGLIT